MRIGEREYWIWRFENPNVFWRFILLAYSVTLPKSCKCLAAHCMYGWCIVLSRDIVGRVLFSFSLLIALISMLIFRLNCLLCSHASYPQTDHYFNKSVACLFGSRKIMKLRTSHQKRTGLWNLFIRLHLEVMSERSEFLLWADWEFGIPHSMMG